MKTNIPNRLPVTFRDAEAEAEFDYDAGETQWFDAKAGVGSPGYPAFVELVAVFLDGKQVSFEELTEEEQDDIEQQLMDQIDEIMGECDAY